MGSFNTAQNRLAAIMVMVLGYLSSPLLFGAYLYYSLGRGYYPPEADSVGLPFAALLFLWIVCFPVFLALCFSIEIVGRQLALVAVIDD